MAVQDNGNDLEKLYKVVSEKFDIGDFDTFSSKMKTKEDRLRFYNAVSERGFDLGDYDTYENRLGKQSEVSGQGSENTSQTSTEPSQPSQNIRDLDQLTPESVIVSEATPEDYRLAEQGLRRVLVDVPVVGLGDTNLTRKAEFIIPEVAVTLEPTLTEVTTDGKIDYVLKYTDEDGVEQIVAERVPEVVTDKGMGSDALNSLYAGLSQVNAMLASIPEFLYNVAAVPQNLIADVVENYAGEETADLLRPSYSYVSQGKFNPLNWLSRYANQQRQLSEEFNAQITPFENDIIESLGEGKYSDAGRQILNTTIQSAPSMLLMAMTGGAGSALRLGTIGRSTVMAIPFASGAFQEIDESTPENVRVLYSTVKGFNEILYEGAFGTLPILRQLGDKVLGKPAMKEIVEGYMRAALSKNGIPASIMKGGLSEMATAFSNEAVDVYGLRIKDAIDWRTVLNEGIVGSVSDGTLSAINLAIPDRSKRKRADELQSQITAVMQDIDNATSENQVQVLESTLESKVAELDAIVAESVDLPKPVRDQLTEIASQEKEIELMLQSENVSEESKVALQEQLANLENQKQQILNEQQSQSETTQETTETTAESGEVASVGTEAQQTQELVTEGTTEGVTDVQQTEGFVPTEQDVQVSSELSTPTFFQTLSDSEARKARLAELRQRLSDSLKQDQNLGIANDPRTRAERDAQFLRDLTELAILAIADGTVKTAQAFKNFVGNVGDFSEDIINRAFYNAQEVAQSYIDTNPQGTSEAIGDVFARMQDVSRTRGTTKVTSSQVKQLTDGGIKGRESMTARQALSHQIKTLNRGARDMAKNVRELAGTIRDYIESQSERFKGVKFNSTELRSIARQVSGIVNEERLEKALAVVDKALENAGFRAKLGKIEGLQNRVKRAAKSRRMPQDLGKTIRDFANINPRDLNDVAQIEEYHGMLESISKLGVKPSGVSVEAMKQMIDIANANNEISRQERAERREQNLKDPEWQAEQIKKKTKELRELGFEEDMIDALLDPTKPFEEVMKGLEEAMASMKQTRKDVIRDTANKLLRNIQENIDNIYSQMSPSDARNLREFLDILNIDHIQDNQLMGLNYVLNNILNNGDIQGLGRFKAMAIAHKKAADTNLRQKALGNLRKIGEFADSIRKKLFATLDIRREAIFKDSRLAGIVDNFFGFQAYHSGMTKVENELKALQIGVDAIIRKYTKGDKKYWQDSYKNAMAGVYAIVAQYRSSWTPEQIRENYVGRVKAVVESLDRLRNEAALTGRKKYDPTIKVLEKVVDKIADVTRDTKGNIETVEPKMTLDQMWNELGEGHKEYYNYAREWFEANKEEFFTVTRMFSNEVIEDDWVNYFPMSYLDYTKTEEYGSGARGDVDLTEIINGFHLRSTTNNLSAAGTARTITGDMLPRHKIFNFDLLGRFEVEAAKILADIYTLEDKWVLNNMTDIRNNGLMGTPDQPAGFEVHAALTYRQLVAERIEADQDSLKRGGRSQDVSVGAVWSRVMGLVGTIRALGGPEQWVKQLSPLFEMPARLKSNKSLGLAIKIRAGINTGDLDVSHIMSRANVQFRADQESLFNLTNKSRSINTEIEKSAMGIAKALGLKVEDLLINGKLSKHSLGALVGSDKHYAEVGWLALYIDHATDGGKKKLDLSEVNEDAVSYANHTNNVVMNTSEKSNQGSYSKSWLRLYQPMLGFSINSMHTLIIASSKLIDARRNGDSAGVKRYLAEVAGNFANVIAFGVISWGVRSIGIWGSELLTKGDIELTEDDEERKKRLLEAADEYYDGAYLLNNARSINYILTDILTRGIFSEAINPIMGAFTDKSGLQKAIFGEEELRNAGYTYKPYNSIHPNPFINALETYAPMMGVQGIGLTSTIGAGENIAGAIQFHEEFIRRLKGYSDFEGKNIRVEYADLTPEGIEKFGIPDYMRYANGLFGVMGLAAIMGLSSQTGSTMVRHSKKAINAVVEEDRGRVRTDGELERLMEARTSFKDIEVDGVKLKLKPEEERKYKEMYHRETAKIDKRYSRYKKKMTDEEYQDAVSNLARNTVTRRILKDYRKEFRDKKKVDAMIRREAAKWREQVIKLNKLAEQK